MCVTSAVYDQYSQWMPQPSWPGIDSWPRPQWVPPVQNPQFTPEPDELRELIDGFHKAVEAARSFDKLTGQPDCEDPDKAALEDRVTELERRLAALEEA